MLENTIIQTIRAEFEANIQTQLTFVSGVTTYKEAEVIQEFIDADETYPCVVIDLTTSDTPSRYVGHLKNNVLQFDVYIMTVRPSTPNHLVLCADLQTRSARQLAEYLAVKVYNYLNTTYVPTFNFIDKDVNLVLNPDFTERDGVFKTVVQFRLLI